MTSEYFDPLQTRNTRHTLTHFAWKPEPTLKSVRREAQILSISEISRNHFRI